MAHLPLEAGAWRASNETAVIRFCYSARFCPNDNGTLTCAYGHTGPFCEVCLSDFHRSAMEGCVPCEGSGVSFVAPLAVIGGVLLLVCVSSLLARKKLKKEMETLQKEGTLNKIAQSAKGLHTSAQTLHASAKTLQKTEKMLRAVARRGKEGSEKKGTVMVKLRIIISLIQVLNGVGVSFDIRYPDFFAQVLSMLSAIELDLPAVMPLSCVVPISFHTSLIASTALPGAIVLFLALVSSCLRRLIRRMPARVTEDGKEPVLVQVQHKCNDVIFLILFLICTPVPRPTPS